MLRKQYNNFAIYCSKKNVCKIILNHYKIKHRVITIREHYLALLQADQLCRDYMVSWHHDLISIQDEIKAFEESFDHPITGKDFEKAFPDAKEVQVNTVPNADPMFVD